MCSDTYYLCWFSSFSEKDKHLLIRQQGGVRAFGKALIQGGGPGRPIGCSGSLGWKDSLSFVGCWGCITGLYSRIGWAISDQARRHQRFVCEGAWRSLRIRTGLSSFLSRLETDCWRLERGWNLHGSLWVGGDRLSWYYDFDRMDGTLISRQASLSWPLTKLDLVVLVNDKI